MSKVFYSLKEVSRVLRKDYEVFLVTSKSLSQGLGWAIRELKVPKTNVIIIPDGEKAKNWDELHKLLQKFSELGIHRSSTVFALGGGSVGDLVGFAASIYLRGIKYIQIPTTLLAQVDSSHGGKTGIDFKGYKNQIGSFYHPEAVIVDTRFLLDIPEELIVDGLGEIIKAGFIKDTSILKLLEEETVSTLPKSKYLLTIIEKTIAVKEFYTRSDLKDVGERQILNFGHTVGHAIELKYKINHGRAVLIGMFHEFRFAEKLNLINPSLRYEFLNLLSSLSIKIDEGMHPDWKNILHDKKMIGDKIILPIVERKGKATLHMVPLKKLKQFLK